LKTGSAVIETKADNIPHKYELYWSGNAVKRHHGVGIAIKIDTNIEIVEVTPVNGRIIVADVIVHGCSLRVINCYAPTEGDSDSTKNAFYYALNKQFKCDKTFKIVCLGDFNATTSASWRNCSLRENIVIDNLEVNNNGERFHQLLNTHCLSVLNTWFDHKKCRRITWHSPDGTTKKIYDFILVGSWLRQYATNCRVYNSYDFDSDHRLVIAHMHTPCNKIARYVRRSTKTAMQRLDTTALNDEVIMERFNTAVADKLETISLRDSDNTMLNNHLTDAVNTAAEDILPNLEKSKLFQPWHNDVKLKELYDLKDKQIARNADFKTLSTTRKKIRLRARHLRNEYFKAEAEKINQLAINRELEKLFHRAKKQDTTLKSAQHACPPDQILEHFKAHFNPEDPSRTTTPEELNNSLPSFVADLQNISKCTSVNDIPPTIEEIQTQLNNLKSNKASNDIDPNLLKKCEHPIMLEVIHKMTTNLWDNIDIPNTWGNSRLKTLWKGKGSKKDPKKYRGLSIGSTVCKLIINIILARLRPWYEAQLTDEQNGFRKNRGTTDGIYTVKRAQQIANRKKQSLFLLFVDLTAAFDHIPRKWLFDSITLRFPAGHTPRLVNILEKLYENTSLTYDKSIFKTSSGVRQGGPESPFLFNLFIDFVMRVFMERCERETDVKFFNHKFRFNSRCVTKEERLNMRNQNIKTWGTSLLPWCGYADDLILFLLDTKGLQRATELLDEVFTNFGLSINVSKTESMIMNQSSDEYPNSIVNLKQSPLNNVREFKYLGSYLHYDEPNTGDVELNHRIQMANCKFAELSNLLQNFRINLRTRVKFLNSFVRSRLTYSCQNWNLSSGQYDRLDVCYRVLLRRMVRGGFKRVNEFENEFQYRYSNAKIHDLCKSKDVSDFVKEQQFNYASHVVRMSLNRSTKQLAFNDDKYTKRGRSTQTLIEQVVLNKNTTIDDFCNMAIKRKST